VYENLTPHPATGLKRGTFGIARLRDGQRAFAALVQSDGQVIDLSDTFADTQQIFDDWERHFDQLLDIDANRTARYEFSSLHALAPLTRPNLLCAGSNYKSHVAQMMTKNRMYQHLRRPGESDADFYQRNLALMERRAKEGVPFLWTGLHSSLTGANDDVILPAIGEQPDWELELGVVVGRHQRFASPDEAQQLIAGYVMVNDLGTVDLARRNDVPFQFDWISKHQPTFKPCGPFIVPAAFVSMDEGLQIQLKVNGEVMQDWPANDMIFRPPQLLTYLSERIHLLPGDLVLTGSPPGNGAHHGRFLTAGDVIDSTITYLGRQRNFCRQEQKPARGLFYPEWKDLGF
jgi:2-keto-4-pentenoate hydratase/2-oxohepta-3-ene-1,7-dioic acid hydratase in catechol pathway